jgi:CHASE2 domain-containing sensor protein
MTLSAQSLRNTTVSDPALPRAGGWRQIVSCFGRVLRARWLWILFGALAVEMLLEQIGAIRPIDSYVFDTMFWLQDSPQSQRVVLVTIDNADYREHFDRRSPLDARKVFDAVRLIARGRPCVIGVDLDTSGPDFAKATALPENVVWARGAAAVEDKPETGGEGIPAAIECDGFLGGAAGYRTYRDEEGRLSTHPASGVALACIDPDGVVRRYAHCFHGVDIGAKELPAMGPSEGLVDSLAWKIVSEYRRRHNGAETRVDATQPRSASGREEELAIIHFSPDRLRFQHIRFSTLLQKAERSEWLSVFQDKIVLLGGTYRAARDEHATPVGARHGMEVVAEEIDTDCDGRNVRHAGHVILLGLHLLPALLIWGFYRLWPSPASILLSIPLIFLSVGISFLVFQSFAFFLNFAIVPLGMWVHVLVESVPGHQTAH